MSAGDLARRPADAVHCPRKPPAGDGLRRPGGGGLLRGEAAAEQALASFFSGRRLGGPVLLAELGDLLYHVEGVENYRLLAPAADLAAEDGTLPMLGRVTVTEMEADDDV